jgi:hypothetical protein
MFKIIGGDGREYGPVDVETLKCWFAEGRLNAATRALREGTTQWTTLAEIPELSVALRFAELNSALVVPGAQRTNPLAVTGFILGLLALPCGMCCCCAYGFPFSLPGIVLSSIALAQIKNNPQLCSGKGFAIAGLVLSILSMLLTVGFFVLGFALSFDDITRELSTP